MTKLSKFWTASIAYVALTVGAGLSIMYNVLDTSHVRGPAFDWADLVTAVAAPGIVLLMVEMFVSRIWDGQRWQIQVIRWLATLAIGGVAMLASWTHGHDFMASRGQTVIVATAWPLAIDLLAIMATALILAGRRGQLGHVANPMATGQTKSVAMATTELGSTYPVASGHEPGQPWPPFLDQDVAMSMADVEWADATATQPMDPSWDIAAEVEQMLAAPATVKARPPVNPGVPEQAREFIARMLEQNAQSKEIDEAVSEMCMVSPRTARRYRAVVTEQLNREEK